MTTNQIAYLKAKEEARHNSVVEYETNRTNVRNEGLKAEAQAEAARHNVATEDLGILTLAETERSNRVRETETERSNRARELETNRHNYVTEREEIRKNTETERSNRAREAETNRSNVANEYINLRNVIEHERHNKATEYETHRSNVRNEYLKEYDVDMRYKGTLMGHASNERIASVNRLANIEIANLNNKTKTDIADADRSSKENIEHDKVVKDYVGIGVKGTTDLIGSMFKGRFSKK